MIGKKIGHYEVTARIGHGGMGEVYLAEDASLDRKVALKFLPESLQQHETARRRFQREARAAAALDHPFICKIFEVGEADGQAFISMEYVEGQTLKERLDQEALPVEETLRIACEIAEALEKAHASNIVHRDLKPSNVMLTTEGHVKIMDFGLAKRVASDKEVRQEVTATDLTQEGATIGTVPYMSPEQLRGQQVDARSDIFSFGVMLYEMLASVHPFRKPDGMETASAILKDDPPSLYRYSEAVPPALQHVVRKMLAKKPESRHQSMHEVLTDLQQLRRDPESQVSRNLDRRLRSRRPLHAALTVLLLLASVTLGYLWLTSGPAPEPPVSFEVRVPSGLTFNLDPEVPGPAVISPDGRTIAFSARDAKGQVRLHVRSLDRTTTRVLEGTDGAYYPFWSPDSSYIGFFAHGRLQKIRANGGSPVSLCEAPSSRGASWGSEGVVVFAPGGSSPIYGVSEEGGESTPLTRLDPDLKEVSHRHPRFLPDGRRFLFLAKSAGVQGCEALMVGSLSGSRDPLQLRSSTQAQFASGYLLYLQGTTLMGRLFDSSSLAFRGEAVPLAEGLTIDNDANHAVFSVSAEGTLIYQAGVTRSNSRLEWFARQGKSL